jgi:hypothetical protein
MAVAGVKWENPIGMVLFIHLRISPRFVLIFTPKLYINNWVRKEMHPTRSKKRKSDG